MGDNGRVQQEKGRRRGNICRVGQRRGWRLPQVGVDAMQFFDVVQNITMLFETLVAVWPRAGIGFLPCVGENMIL